MHVLQSTPTTWAQSRSACARPTRVSRCWSWRRSSTLAATWRGAAVSRWHTRCAWASGRWRCGSRTGACAGRKTTSYPTPKEETRTRRRRTATTTAATAAAVAATEETVKWRRWSPCDLRAEADSERRTDCSRQTILKLLSKRQTRRLEAQARSYIPSSILCLIFQLLLCVCFLLWNTFGNFRGPIWYFMS